MSNKNEESIGYLLSILKIKIEKIFGAFLEKNIIKIFSKDLTKITPKDSTMQLQGNAQLNNVKKNSLTVLLYPSNVVSFEGPPPPAEIQLELLDTIHDSFDSFPHTTLYSGTCTLKQIQSYY